MWNHMDSWSWEETENREASEETTSGVGEGADSVAGMMERVDVRDLGRETHGVWHLCRWRRVIRKRGVSVGKRDFSFG